MFEYLFCYFSSYIRGQNVPVDAETKRELEDKRKKYLENQVIMMH